MIKRFIRKLMERRKRNKQFRKDFYEKTGVDLDEIDNNVGGGQQFLLDKTKKAPLRDFSNL